MVFGVPLGISFFRTAFSEPTLIKLASGFEAATQVRTQPTHVHPKENSGSLPASPSNATREQGKEHRRPHHL
jgi:hypothetical protein